MASVFELEFGFLLVLVFGIYFSRITQPTIRGEESRRAQVAVEMIQTDHWTVPRYQGVLFLSRPPLQNWVIALIGKARGIVDEFAVRLPSALAILLIACLIYRYARLFLSPAGSLLAAAGYATMGQVLELGRLGETEALFTLFVSSSLLVWHWGDSKDWPKNWTWSLAYLLAALGTLTKGPQAPVYFVSVVGAYLFVKGRWRELVSSSHLVGVLTFLVAWSAWQIPFSYELGWQAVQSIYVSDVSFRFEDSRFQKFVSHLFVYPFEVLLGCLLPWSTLLVAMFSRDFWKSLGPAREHATFLLICVAVTFPTCWMVPGAVGRYYMPLYPCIALLIGLVAERCWLSDQQRTWQKAWSRFLAVLALLMIAVAVCVFLISCGFAGGAAETSIIAAVDQTPQFAVVYLAICSVLAVIAYKSRLAANPFQQTAGVLAASMFLGLTYVGLYINCLQHSSNNTREQVIAVKSRLPEGQRLFSLGLADHQCAFHFREPIPLQEWPETVFELPTDFNYFCFIPDKKRTRPLPFSWEQLAVVTCDRNRKKHPEHKVIVARRRTDLVSTDQTSNPRR